MKKTFRAIVIAAAAVTVLFACSKETAPGEAVKMEKGKIGVSVSALMAELTPAEGETKASVASVVRLTWEDADTVSAFCGSEYLGHLNVSVSDDNKMVAKLSGNITTPTSGTTITLIHSNIKPTVSGSAVSVDLSDQKTTEEDPFVVYGTLEYTKTDITNQVVPFKFATSLMFVTVTGLNDSGVDSVMVSEINTVCRLTVSADGEPTVEGTTPGTITTKVDESNRSGERAIFNIGIVSAAAGTRKITAVQGDTKSGADFTSKELDASASYISVYALKVKETADYVVMKMGSEQSQELKWHKKNLGATTIAGDLGTCAGYYFAWGGTEGYIRNNEAWESVKDGLVLSGGFSQANAPHYGSAYTKYTSSDSKTVLESGDDAATALLGSGWRMPTSAEFKDLYDACLDGSYNKTTNPSGASASVGKGVYWCTSYDGVAGCLFCDGTNKLFFPAAGFGDGTGLTNASVIGSYWSSSLYTDKTGTAYLLNFSLFLGVNPQYRYDRYRGFPVRPVSD